MNKEAEREKEIQWGTTGDRLERTRRPPEESGIEQKYSRVKPRDLTLEPTDRAVALSNSGQAFLFLGPCGMVESILYRGLSEDLNDRSASHTTLPSRKRAAEAFISPFGRRVVKRVRREGSLDIWESFEAH
ncbi:hypothetical protein F2Q70_00032688 [Brassica cretica]|uniref:Uncharacterized protein n=1 Tax=Brassica cretica TaxID=69181 RepID=A0A8S9FFM3_BRACR|nr:hypothetical protein F2Q70_00032688 [Brassica cretica]